MAADEFEVSPHGQVGISVRDFVIQRRIISACPEWARTKRI